MQLNPSSTSKYTDSYQRPLTILQYTYRGTDQTQNDGDRGDTVLALASYNTLQNNNGEGNMIVEVEEKSPGFYLVYVDYSLGTSAEKVNQAYLLGTPTRTYTDYAGNIFSYIVVQGGEAVAGAIDTAATNALGGFDPFSILFYALIALGAVKLISLERG